MLVEVEINTTGAVDKCSIYKSSGYARLDRGSLRSHRSQLAMAAPTRNSVPVTVKTQIYIVWDLKRGSSPSQ